MARKNFSLSFFTGIVGLVLRGLKLDAITLKRLKPIVRKGRLRSKNVVVIPVYNEQETVRQIIARVKALPVPTEIIVVDDCSTDATSAALEPLAVLPGIQVIRQAVTWRRYSLSKIGFDHICAQW